MYRYFLFLFLLSCGSRKRVKVIKEDVIAYKATQTEIRDDWRNYLVSKGVSNSLCVQGLLARLDEWECSKVEVEKFDNRVTVICLPNQDNRLTFWERHGFVIERSVLLNNNVNRIRIQTNPSICIDTIQKVIAYEIEDSYKEHIKMKQK
tara:strand:+ start:226 stop:672 length:447 start_codon:yes stop_codon:yes gene_type:complete